MRQDDPRTSAPPWWRPALAAAAVIILLEGVALAVLLRRQGGLEAFRREPPGAALEVTFAAEATEAGIREALWSVNARIVDGPSAIGVYTVQIPAADGDRAQVEAAIDRLAATAGVVAHVERQ